MGISRSVYYKALLTNNERKIKKTSWQASAALFTDFSKAFDYLSHDLFIAKLNAFDSSMTYLQHIMRTTATRDNCIDLKFSKVIIILENVVTMVQV